MQRTFLMPVWLLVALIVVPGLTAGCEASQGAAGGVSSYEQPMTLPWWTSEPVWKVNPNKSSALWPQKGSQKADGERAFQTVVLENEFLQVQVVPEAGGVISGAIYKPTGEDVFFREQKAKDWLPFWESGVKVCFPFREHCVATQGQPASYRVIEHEDGSVTLAMWMEFSRHTQPYQATMFGRYSNMMLSQRVTLRPGESVFSITYRIVNPAPYRQGRRVWTDAFFPRHHLPEGIVQGAEQPPKQTASEWIYPVKWISGHLAKDIREMDPKQLQIRNIKSEHFSVFALDPQYGFAGVWYPLVGVNRLRLSDPEVAPATKLYCRGEGNYRTGDMNRHMCNFLEVWGGLDHVMEGVENWLAAGEAYEFTHHYTMVRGIGKADYADRDVVVDVRFGDEKPGVDVVTLRPVEKLRVLFEGAVLGEMVCGPEQPARFGLPKGAKQGTVRIEADGQVLVSQAFPLPMAESTEHHEAIRRMSQADNIEARERLNDQMDYGRELDDTMNMYPAGSLGRGRLQYRLGRVEAAIKTLTAHVEAAPASGEGWHLLGMALLESGEADEAKAMLVKATEAAEPEPAALYYLAVMALGEGKAEAAKGLLGKLMVARPGHVEARLLAAWVGAGPEAEGEAAYAAASELVAMDPADPRALLVLERCAAMSGREGDAKRAGAALKRMLAEPGAARRIEEFKAATAGRYMPPLRLERK